MNKQKKNELSRGIEWCDFTWNPVAGCFHACQWTMPDGSVANCYAEDVATRVAGKAYPQGFEHHYWYPQRLSEPSKLKEPSKIFVGSMADVFGHWVATEQIQAIIDVCSANPKHTFQFLTKNATRAKPFHLPSNSWLGTSTPPTFMWNKPLSEDQQKRMMRHSLQMLASAHTDGMLWISAEPLTFDLAPLLQQYPNLINWIVIGAASNGKKEFAPKAEYVERLLTECQRQGIAVFYKGNMKTLPLAVNHWLEEFPNGG